MAKKKKSGEKKNPVEKLLLITAILELIRATVNLIETLIE